jgi:UDP-2,3-diacylglucosamine pyrophosphatase LpxH
VLVTSDLHFPGVPSEASQWTEKELSEMFGAVEGPAMLILAGDVIELWAGERPSAAEAMAAHPSFAAAVRAFGSHPGRRVVCLPGNHDGCLGWDPDAVRVVQQDLGAELAFSVDLALTTANGPRIVHIEHGHRWDPANAFHDPRDPLDTPLGQHVVQEVLPDLAASAESSLLQGLDALADPRTFPAFVTSRVFYRRLVKELRWLIVPLLVAAGIHYGIFLLDEPAKLRLTARDFVVFNIALVIVVLVTAAVLMLAGRRTWTSASSGMAHRRGRAQNDNARAAAEEMIAIGHVGLVSGHTHHAELTPLGQGFYANSGSGTKVVEQCEARLHFPHVFLTRLQLSWVELEAGEDGWRVQLWAAHRPSQDSAWIERVMARPDQRAGHEPSVVASFPS